MNKKVLTGIILAVSVTVLAVIGVVCLTKFRDKTVPESGSSGTLENVAANQSEAASGGFQDTAEQPPERSGDNPDAEVEEASNKNPGKTDPEENDADHSAQSNETDPDSEDQTSGTKKSSSVKTTANNEKEPGNERPGESISQSSPDPEKTSAGQTSNPLHIDPTESGEGMTDPSNESADQARAETAPSENPGPETPATWLAEPQTKTQSAAPTAGTAAPATHAQTTLAPTTAVTSTAAPTTAAPATSAPTTAAPTTAVPTTTAEKESPTENPTQRPTAAPTTTEETTQAQTQHVHAWVKTETRAGYDETILVRDAWSEQVLVSEAYDKTEVVKEAWDEVLSFDAWDEPVVEYHEICNACGADLTAMQPEALAAGYTSVIDYHIDQTGTHGGWHTVAVETGDVIHHPAETQTIHHEAEYRTVHIDAVYKTVNYPAEYTTVHHDPEYVYRCSGCGETRDP